MIKIKARGEEGVEQMLKRFKKLCDKEGLAKATMRVSFYEKPSERRRRRIRNSSLQSGPVTDDPERKKTYNQSVCRNKAWNLHWSAGHTPEV